MRPLHHGEGVGGGNWLQRLNDSDAGVLAASILHSVGALLFAAGIGLYLYVAHSLRRGAREGGPAGVGLLNYAHGFTLAGIALNGAGGVARLYESDHPSLSRLGDSTWVQVLFVKHVFLAAGVALAGYLAWRTWSLSRPAPDMPRLRREATRMTFLSAASLATIMLAAVLGAVATNTDLAKDLGTPPEPAPETVPPASTEPQVLAESVTTGVITDPTGGGSARESQFTVPADANQIVVVLRWGSSSTTGTADMSQLTAGLKDPGGRVPDARATSVGRSITLTVEGLDVRSGVWTIAVSGEQAVQEEYVLRVTALRSDGTGNFAERTETIASGRFFEANLIMAAQQTIAFQWEVVGSERPVAFNIHLHPAGGVVYPVQGTWNRYAGNYTHDGSTQGPSLMWENEGPDPITVHARIRGAFSVHSYS